MNDELGLDCQDKLAFDNQKAAEAEALAIEFRRGTKLKAYQCRDCKLWHLSSNATD